MQNNVLLKAVLQNLDSLKALNIQPLDVRHLSSITDYMIIATGTSSRHVNAIADNLVRDMKARQIQPYGVNSDHDNEWALVDLGDIVVHIMQNKAREFYHLEKLWDAQWDQQNILSLA